MAGLTRLCALGLALGLLFASGAGAGQPADPRFPFSVHGEFGASWFQGGDALVIQEIHGSIKDFKAGGIYQIKGKYRLLTQPQATLQAGVTAANGNAPMLSPEQSLQISRGIGDFVLVLPYLNEGRPTISFISTDPSNGSVENVSLTPDQFPLIAAFKQTGANLQKHDSLVIRQIRASSAALAAGGKIQIWGTLTLASQDLGLLVAGTTREASADGNNLVQIGPGKGTFTLEMTLGLRPTGQIGIWQIGSAGTPFDSVTFEIEKTKAAPATQPALAMGPNSGDSSNNISWDAEAEGGAQINEIPSGPGIPRPPGPPVNRIVIPVGGGAGR